MDELKEELEEDYFLLDKDIMRFRSKADDNLVYNKKKTIFQFV